MLLCCCLSCSSEILLKGLGQGGATRPCYSQGFCWARLPRVTVSTQPGLLPALSHFLSSPTSWHRWAQPQAQVGPAAGTACEQLYARLQRHAEMEMPSKNFVCVDTKCSPRLGITLNSSQMYPGSSRLALPLSRNDARCWFALNDLMSCPSRRSSTVLPGLWCRTSTCQSPSFLLIFICCSILPLQTRKAEVPCLGVWA